VAKNFGHRTLVAAMQQITDWRGTRFHRQPRAQGALKKLGMSEYARFFAENKIDISVLPDLTEQHLKDLGVPLGDRLKMLRAIRDLGDASATVTAPSTPAVTEPTRRDDAERRQLTVMFTDLVGSTAPSTKPEDLHSVIASLPLRSVKLLTPHPSLGMITFCFEPFLDLGSLRSDWQ
jgi:hypothetical protein